MRDAIGPVLSALIAAFAVLYTQRSNNQAKRERDASRKATEAVLAARDSRAAEGEAYQRALGIDTGTIQRLQAALTEATARLERAERRIDQLEVDGRKSREIVARMKSRERIFIHYVSTLRMAMRQAGIPVPPPPDGLDLSGVMD